MEAAFNWRQLHDSNGITEKLNNVIDALFFIDLCMNFRTTFFNQRTGQEIIEIKDIQRNYLQGSFMLDLLSTIPFDVVYELFIDP